MTHGV